MQTLNLKESPNVKALIVAAFPSYRKHKAWVSTFGSQGVNINSYWSGGSRDEYVLVHIPTQRVKALPTSTHPYFDVSLAGAANSETPDLVSDARGNVTLKRLPPDYALVQAGIFCGKAATAQIYFSAENRLEGGR